MLDFNASASLSGRIEALVDQALEQERFQEVWEL